MSLSATSKAAPLAIAEPAKLRTGVKVSVELVSTTVQKTLILTMSPTSNLLAGIM